VTSIDFEAFRDSGLTSIEIQPGGLTSISASVFYGSKNLTSIEIPEGVTSIGNEAFRNCSGLTSIEIPPGVESIGEYAFQGCGALTSIEIPASVEIIGDHAFQGSGLTSIEIPVSVKSIGEYAFQGCDALASIEIPVSVVSIGNSAFQECGILTSIELPVGVTSIGNSAFQGCGALTSIELPVGVTSIGEYTFFGCRSLTSIEIPEGVISIGNYAFDICDALTSIEIPASVTSIGNNAFNGCSKLTSINIPDSVNSIGAYAFSGSGIEGVHIPGSVTTIGTAARSPFRDMSGLKSIVFGHKSTSIPAYALSGSFPNSVYVYVPPGVLSADADVLPIDSSSKDKLIIRGMDLSYIKTWADENSVAFESIRSWITEDDLNAWQLVPYQYIIETNTPDNADMAFEIVGGALPEGLALFQDGQFHGAPLETGTFTFDVAVYFTLFTNENEAEYLLDLQEITLTVKEPSDEDLALTNDYDVDKFVGVPAVPGVPGGYVLSGSRTADGLNDPIFKIADSYQGDPIDYNNFRYFVDVWLDGERLMRVQDYEAESGSTVVTVQAKTFQSLDNGSHTLAAEFMMRDPTGGGGPAVQKVAAQKFTLDLTGVYTPDAPGGQDPETPPPSVPDGKDTETPISDTPDSEDTETPIPGATDGDNAIGGSPASDSGAGTSPAPAAQAEQTGESPADSAGDSPFGDVTAGDWFYEDVLYVNENGLMTGTSATMFSPQIPMTRGMIITVLGRHAGADASAYAQSGFTDAPAGAYYTPYARSALETLVAGGVINGKPGGILDPTGRATRAEVAAVLHRFLEIVEYNGNGQGIGEGAL
jgi:hypothetical protein